MFPFVVPLTTLYKLTKIFESVDEICCVIIQMEPTKTYFPMVLLIVLHKVVLTFETVGEILKCHHSNESYRAVLSCGTVYYAVQGGSKLLSLWMKS